MNWAPIEENWKLARIKMKEKWWRLTENDIEEIAGVRDALIEKLEQRYGIEKDEANQQVREFERSWDIPRELEKTA